METTREEMISKIYDTIAYNKYIFELTSHNGYVIDGEKVIMIGDVLDYMKKDKELAKKRMSYRTEFDFYKSHAELRIKYREHTKKPIQEQSDDCIKFVYNLYKDKE